MDDILFFLRLTSEISFFLRLLPSSSSSSSSSCKRNLSKVFNCAIRSSLTEFEAAAVSTTLRSRLGST